MTNEQTIIRIAGNIVYFNEKGFLRNSIILVDIGGGVYQIVSIYSANIILYEGFINKIYSIVYDNKSSGVYIFTHPTDTSKTIISLNNMISNALIDDQQIFSSVKLFYSTDTTKFMNNFGFITSGGSLQIFPQLISTNNFSLEIIVTSIRLEGSGTNVNIFKLFTPSMVCEGTVGVPLTIPTYSGNNDYFNVGLDYATLAPPTNSLLTAYISYNGTIKRFVR